MRMKHRIGALALAGALASPFLIGASTCTPPPPPPPPPTTTVPKPVWEQCPSPYLASEPYTCIMYTQHGPAWGLKTNATGVAATKEPATLINIQLRLYLIRADGTPWLRYQNVGNWGTNTQSREMVASPTFPIECEPGRYYWEMQVRFASKPRTVYWQKSAPFILSA